MGNGPTYVGGYEPTPSTELGGSLPAALFRKATLAGYFQAVNGFWKSVTEVQEKRDIWKIRHNYTIINRNFTVSRFCRPPAADTAFRPGPTRPVPPYASEYLWPDAE